MGKGKIGAQCSHAVLKTINQASSEFRWDNRMNVYSVSSEEELFKLKNDLEGNPIGLVRDAGRTQIAAGTYTVLGVLLPLKELKSLEGMKLL